MTASDEVRPARLTLSVSEAADACGVSERTLRGLIAAHRFPHVRVGGRVLVVKSALETWLREHSARTV